MLFQGCAFRHTESLRLSRASDSAISPPTHLISCLLIGGRDVALAHTPQSAKTTHTHTQACIFHMAELPADSIEYL